MSHYVAIVRRDPDSDFGVEFPDLPGCISGGRTLEEALAMGREALALHLHGMAEDNEAIPLPRTLREIGPIDGDDVQAVLTLEPLAGLDVERITPAASAAVELAELVELLPDPRPTVASRLGVSESTLRGWLRSARGEPVAKRHSGGTPPSARVLASARELVLRHASECVEAASRAR